jgi:multidrug efflux pump subunit AcrB
MPNPPTYNKVNPADTPILTLQITSDTLPLEKVNDLADTVLAQKLSEVSGVGLVTIEGSQKPAVRVRINPAAIASLGLSLEDVRTALTQNNINAPKGSFDGTRQSYAIGANDQILSAAEYRPVVVAYKNGSPIRLGDIGEVIDDVENVRLAGWVGDKPSVILDIQRQPGANAAAETPRVHSAIRQGFDSDGPHRDHPRVSPRRPVHAGSHRVPRRHGHVRLLAKVLGDRHPQRRVAVGHHRHVRRHETGRFQPG